tara:strand:+ start:52 stop:807 length:756 start_codon:yes stop_codon:yes gene_type:complete
MVMSTEPQELDTSVDIAEPAVAEEEGQVEAPEAIEAAPAGEVEAAPTEVAGGPTNVVATPPPPPPPAAPQVDQKAIQELEQHRAMEQERTWREKVGRAARAYEQQLQESGYMPEQARDQARRYVQQEQKFRKQDTEASNMVGYVQGRQAAAVHFMEKHGLANKQMLNDLMALQQTNSPAEMEKEAQRMKNDRALRAENTRLKQGRVAPQAFDNSQGAAEASSNDNRLLDAYNNGDRSEAAVRAARRLALGS